MIRALVATLALASLPLAATAAPSGLAWDSVTKIMPNTDLSSVQPGDFDSDFSAASANQIPQSHGGGLFGQMRQAMSMGQSMPQMMQNGFAQRHYVAGSKERTDDLAAGTATITDCTARTITTLDLRRKTYRVVSMDQPAAPSSHASGTPSRPMESDTRVAITMNTTALGARNVGGQPTNGYRADMTITETSASGDSHTQNGSMIGYYSSISRPLPACAGAMAMGGGRGPGMMAAGYSRILQALASRGPDSRFSVKSQGPALPMGELSMFDAVSFTVQSRAAMTFVVERGNVRPISADDPVFSVPSDFTQEQ